MFSIYVFVLFALGLACSAIYQRRKNSKNLPPGPPTLPLIGNLHQAPIEHPERTYLQWSKLYGPIIKLQYGLSTCIVLGTNAIARDLMEKRSNIYSSRPRIVQLGENVTKGRYSVFMPYGNRFRQHQRMQAAFLNPRASRSYTGLQDLETKQLIFELLSTDDFHSCFQRASSSLVLALAYGQRSPAGDELMVKEITKVSAVVVSDPVVGAWIVDSLPFLNYLPKWLAPWKRYAETCHDFEKWVHEKNFAQAEATPSWNWCKEARDKQQRNPISDLELTYDVGLLFGAAGESTSVSLEYVVMAAILNPDVIKKAQAELDIVVGPNRLPSFEDSDQLPYVKALVQETLRWRPIAPAGVPHALTEEDEYRGMRIPKGSVIIPNIWALNREQPFFKDPESFSPDRWIETPDLPVNAWGFGRRMCPGRHIAQNTLFISVARLLWAFDIQHAYEEKDGKLIRCEVDSMALSNGLTCRPMPFKAAFKVRSEQAESVVRQQWNDAEKDIDVILEKVHRTQMEMTGMA